jgi:putative redox protein
MIRLELHRTTGDYGFEIKDSMNHLLQTDNSKEGGGNDSGFRPMQLVLAAMGSCSAIDIVSILKKQRQHLTDISIVIEGEREQDAIPSLWKKVKLQFTLKGNVDDDKANRAAELSVQKYCSVAETLRRSGTEITWTVNNLKSEKVKL